MSELLLFPPPSPTLYPPQVQPALSDTEARAAALDIRHSWIVEAPAGSGKTGLLIQRFLSLLAFADVHRPAEVLVLTFTRKADGELRSRVLEQLAAAAAQDHPLPPTASPFDRTTRDLANAVLARDRALGWHLLDTPAQLNIRTIDSFCAELASAMPLLAGNGRLHTTDDPFPLYQGAAERTLGQLGGPNLGLNDALRSLLLHRDAQVSDCLRLLTDMLAQREQWAELIPLEALNLTDDLLDTVVRPRLERTLQRVVTEALQRAAAALGPEDTSELAHFAARLSTNPGYNGEPNPLAPCSTLPGTLPTTPGHLPHWNAAVDLLLTKGKEPDWRKKPNRNHLKLEIDRPDAQWLEQFLQHLRHRDGALLQALAAIRCLPPARYPEEQWTVVKALCRVLSHGLRELQLVFSERGQCDFTEVALSARALLRPSPDLQGSLRPDLLSTPIAGLQHLLVDEMQDTSAGQYQLLEAVTEFWDGASQTVFLVGDPKQSIYAFRQARVERFLRTMATGRLGELPLSPLRLTANFRSQAELVHAFNQTFQQLFPETSDLADAPPEPSPEDAAIVPFTAAHPTRPATCTPALHWHALMKSPLSPGKTEIDQAQGIRTLIEGFLASWPHRVKAPGDVPHEPKVAVLARNRAHLAPIIAELRRDRGQGPCPFRAVDVEALHERPEVLDLLALTRALLHPADRVAWLAVLRSPVCGLSLPDLLALTGEGPDADRKATIGHLIPIRGQFLSPEGQRLLGKVWPVLQHAQSTLGATPLSTHVERTWRSLGGDAPLRPDQHTNALRFLDLLRRLEAGPDPLSPSLLTQNLRKLYAEPMAIDAPVELMTIHKAKGLEWDLVLVPSLERGSGRNAHSLLKWLELDNAHTEADLLLAPIQGKGEEASALSSWLSAGERRREAAEARRLFYVACTRAREALHLFATLETKADGSLCSPRAPSSLLQAAWPAAEPIFQQHLTQQHATQQHIGAQPAPNHPLVFPTPSAPETLALAAAADLPSTADLSHPARLRRLSPDFDPLARFGHPAGPVLPYTPASALRRAAMFSRPEGSFAARAFGNAVHRFLNLLSTRLAAGQTVQALQTELPSWLPRLTASLRNEGLSATSAAREAQRAIDALLSTLRDPHGAWLLGPHLHARNEACPSVASFSESSLRADRLFLAGSSPFTSVASTHLWIVDYKTADPGGYAREPFLAHQKQHYLAQMQAYALAAAESGTQLKDIRLALYFPLLPGLLYWPATETLAL